MSDKKNSTPFARKVLILIAVASMVFIVTNCKAGYDGIDIPPPYVPSEYCGE